MINKKLKLVTALGSALAIAAPASVFATNGMFLIGYGNKSRGMGGVGITQSQDVLNSAANPANMALLKANRFDMGGDIFIAKSEAYMGQEPNNLRVESTPDHMTIADGIYIMPNTGASWKDGDLTYGFTMVPVGGGGSRYNTNLFNCANATPVDCKDKLGVSLMVMNINPTIAMKIDEHNSVGATLVLGLQIFKAYGLDKFTQFTSTQTSEGLTDNGTDVAYGAGIRLGWLGNFVENKLTLGASYTSQTYMSKFDDYSNLFAEQGQMNTPGNIGVGIAYQILDELQVALDINYVMYEDVAAVSNPGPDSRGDFLFPVDRETNALGKDEGLGFGWSNQTVFKLGISYLFDPTWTLRAGWNYGKSPIDSENDILFSTVAPAITENHLTLGATYQMNKTMELSFSYVHAFEFEQFGPTYINYEGGYTMSQDSFGASFGMNF